MLIRRATDADDEAIWRMLEPVIRTGETYALPQDMRQADALAYWRAPIRLWQRLGFTVVGTLPQAFLHPAEGLVDALVMYREL